MSSFTSHPFSVLAQMPVINHQHLTVELDAPGMSASYRCGPAIVKHLLKAIWSDLDVPLALPGSARETKGNASTLFPCGENQGHY